MTIAEVMLKQILTKILLSQSIYYHPIQILGRMLTALNAFRMTKLEIERNKIS